MQSPTTWEIWAKGQRTSKGKESDPKQIETIIHDSDMTQIENHQKNVPGKWAMSLEGPTRIMVRVQETYAGHVCHVICRNIMKVLGAAFLTPNELMITLPCRLTRLDQRYHKWPAYNLRHVLLRSFPQGSAWQHRRLLGRRGNARRICLPKTSTNTLPVSC